MQLYQNLHQLETSALQHSLRKGVRTDADLHKSAIRAAKTSEKTIVPSLKNKTNVNVSGVQVLSSTDLLIVYGKHLSFSPSNTTVFLPDVQTLMFPEYLITL